MLTKHGPFKQQFFTRCDEAVWQTSHCSCDRWFIIQTYIHKLTPFSHGGKQKQQVAVAGGVLW